MNITITMDIDDEYADPEHATGITEAGYEDITDVLGHFGTDIDVSKAEQANKVDELPIRKICGQNVWPYTENNTCVLKPGHPGPYHQDPKGRRYTPAGYLDRG